MTRNNVTIRMRGDLKSRLKDRADEQGYSLSEEIERRLEQSFRDDKVMEELTAIREAVTIKPETWRDMLVAISTAKPKPIRWRHASDPTSYSVQSGADTNANQ